MQTYVEQQKDIKGLTFDMRRQNKLTNTVAPTMDTHLTFLVIISLWSRTVIALCGSLDCSHGCISHNGAQVCACPAGWTFDKIDKNVCVKERHYNSCDGLSNFNFTLLNDDGTWQPFSSKNSGLCASAADDKVSLIDCDPSNADQRWVYNRKSNQYHQMSLD